MKVSEAAQQAYLLGSNKTPLPNSGPKFDKVIGILNIKQQAWAHESGIEWDSLFDLVSTGTISTASSYELDASIDHITKDNDPVVIKHVNGQQTAYEVVSPRDFAQNPMRYTCTVRQGSLVFSETFTADSPQYKGTIVVPALLKVATITSKSLTKDVAVDDPLWLCYAAAAEYARGTTTKSAQVGNLQAYADALMEKMKENNGGQRTDFDREPTVLGQTWYGYSGYGR